MEGTSFGASNRRSGAPTPAYRLVVNDTTTTESILRHWRIWQESQGLSSRTITERATVVRNLLEYTGEPPLGLTPLGIMSYTGRVELSAASKGTYHASIRAYCLWLMRTDQRTDDPTLKTPTPKRPKGRPRPVFDNQLGAMLAAVNRRRTRMMILLAAMAGLRVHEVAKVHGGDVDLVNGVLLVTGKGGKTAMIPLHDAILAEAHEYPPDGHWFPAYAAQTTAQHITPGAVSAAIKGTMERAGIVGKPHQLRHWYGTTLLAEGVDVRIVKELMRHESLDTTAIYTLVHLDQQRAGIRRLRLPVAA